MPRSHYARSAAGKAYKADMICPYCLSTIPKTTAWKGETVTYFESKYRTLKTCGDSECLGMAFDNKRKPDDLEQTPADAAINRFILGR